MQHNTWGKDRNDLASLTNKVITEGYMSDEEGDGSWMDDLEGGRHKDMDSPVEQDSYGPEERLEVALKLQDTINVAIKRLVNLQKAAPQQGDRKTKDSIDIFFDNLPHSLKSL